MANLPLPSLQLLGCESAARALGVSGQTIRMRIERGHPLALRPVGKMTDSSKRWIFTKEAVDAFVALHGYAHRPRRSGPVAKPTASVTP